MWKRKKTEWGKEDREKTGILPLHECSVTQTVHGHALSKSKYWQCLVLMRVFRYQKFIQTFVCEHAYGPTHAGRCKRRHGAPLEDEDGHRTNSQQVNNCRQWRMLGGDRAQPQARQRPGWVSRAESRAGTQWGGAQRKEEVGVGGWGAGRARHGHERLKQETHLVEGESQWAEPRNRAEKTKARPEEVTISRQETAAPWQAATGQHSSPGLAWRSPICGKGTAVQEDKWKLQQQTLALMTSLHSCLIPLSGKTVEGQNRSQRRPLRKLSIQTSLLDSLVLQICATCKLLHYSSIFVFTCNTPSFQKETALATTSRYLIDTCHAWACRAAKNYRVIRPQRELGPRRQQLRN